MLKPMGIFHTPKDWDELMLWIESSASCDKAMLLTAAGMAWNLAAKAVSWDGHEHESETMQQWSYDDV